MKKSLFKLVACGLLAWGLPASGAVTVTPGSGGSNISADLAANASGAFTTLGNIVIQEGATTDFGTGNGQTLILTAPSGWRFNAGVGTVSRSPAPPTNPRDLGNPNMVVTESSITVTINVGGTASLDTLTISGIQVQSIDGAILPSSGTILRSSANPGTLVVAGVVNDVTSFASLGQAAGAANQLAIITQPSASATGGVPFAQQPVVQVRDQFGNARTAANGTADNSTVVTASLASGPGSLAGTLTATASNGSATFANLSHAGPATITLGFSSGTLTGATSDSIVVKANQTITFGSLAHQTYGVAPITLNATASSGLAVAYTVTGPATLAGNSLTITGVGTVTVFANQAGNVDYHAAPEVSQSFTVSPAPITVTADAKSKTYGDSDPALSYQITSGNLFGSDSISGSLSRVAGENAGAYAIQQGTLSAGSNYNLTFVGANLTISARAITVAADLQSKVYGDADPSFSYQIVSGELQGSDAFSGALSRVAGEDVGTYAIQQGTLSAGSNYALTFTEADLTISARSLTVAADGQTKTYGDADPALTFEITVGALQGSDEFSGALSREAGEDAGTYAIQQGTLSAGSNYALTFAGSDLTISARAITVTADAKNKTYGDADPLLTYEVTTGALQGSDSISGELTRVSGEGVGTYAIQQGTLSAGDNYILSFQGADFIISARAITVTADAKNKGYGDSDPVLTYQITAGALQDGDLLSGNLNREAGENVGTYAINQGTLVADSNYNLTFVGANLTISARTLTVTADARSKTYGDADPALTYQITAGELHGADSISGALSRVAGEAVGIYAIEQGSLTAGGNYNLTYVGADLTISARAITVTAAAQSKVYGDSDPALTYQVTAGVLQESDALTGSLARAAGNNVGAYAIQQGSLTAGSNYDLSFVGADLTITARPLTITADNKSKVYGTENPALTVSYGAFAYSEDESVLGGTLVVSTTATENSGVGAYPIVASGLTSSNYNITFVDGELTVTGTALVISINSTSREYGLSNPAFTGTLNGLEAGDNITVTYTTVADEASEVGTYSITVSAISDPNGKLGNYSVTTNAGTLTVTAAALTVDVDNKSRTYGAANPEFTGTLTGIRNDDDLAVTYVSVADTASVVGNYPITVEFGDVAKLANYLVATNEGVLTVGTAALTVTADNKVKATGQENPVLTGSISGLQNDDVITPLFATTVTTESSAGDYPITVSGYEDLSGKLSNYDVTVNDGVLTVLDAPLITQQPVSLEVDQGATAEFSVGVTGVGISLQWYHNDEPILGADSATLTIVDVQTANLGAYHVVVSNAGTQVISDIVALTMIEDATAPVLKVLTPKANAAYLGSTLLIDGTALDPRLVAVEYSLNDAPFTSEGVNLIFVADKKPYNWNAEITLDPGTNRIIVRSRDLAGNISSSAPITFFSHVASPFTLSKTITPIPQVANGVSSALGTPGVTPTLFIGRPYKAVAVQNFLSGYIFTNWTATWDGQSTPQVLTNGLKLDFVMQPNMAITANFITNPFVRFSGKYHGLFHEEDEVRMNSAGQIVMKVTEKFGVSGKVFVDGNAVSFSGKFNIDGTLNVTVNRAKLEKVHPLTLQLALDFAGASDTATGTLSCAGEGWTSAVLADRATWQSDATAYTNAYTMVLPGFADENVGPAGNGYGLVKVGLPGTIKLAGNAADGHKIKQASVVSKDGFWPLYSPLYLKTRALTTGKLVKETHGMLFGWVRYEANTNAFEGNTNLAPLGDLEWVNLGWTNKWTGGFTNRVALKSSRWVVESPILEGTNFVATVSGGDLTAPFTAELTLNAKSALVAPKPLTNLFKSGLGLKTGLIKGAFTHPDTNELGVKWFGAMLQDYNEGAGYFIVPSTGNSGVVEVTAVPEVETPEIE